MNSNQTIRKARIALDILIKHDQKDSEASFKDVINEIVNSWRELE